MVVEMTVGVVAAGPVLLVGGGVGWLFAGGVFAEYGGVPEPDDSNGSVAADVGGTQAVMLGVGILCWVGPPPGPTSLLPELSVLTPAMPPTTAATAPDASSGMAHRARECSSSSVAAIAVSIIC
jgi:hypothetical protein